MISFPKQGEVWNIGLNLIRTPGGFVAVWVWYDFAKHEARSWRFRFRCHIAPHFLWTVNRWNVIDSYMLVNDMAMVHRGTLEDLKAVEKDVIDRNESFALIKP
jgi:hypothetical protein